MMIDDVPWSTQAMVTVLPVAVLGAVCGLDVVSFPQAMISRPIVAATAAGALAGDASAGLLVGAALELIALETLPVGASRYPEWGSASVVGGTLAAAAPAGSPATIAVTILATLATAAVGGWSMVALRKWNATRARTNLPALERGSARTVNALQLGGLTADLARGAALTVVALLALSPLVHAAATHWAVDARTSVAVVAGAAAAIAAAAAWRLFHGIPGTRWLFGAGLVGGLALVAWR
jgi:mannose/fructose/N-acetylgalactosamine-specific phosphotransferase system component IIC